MTRCDYFYKMPPNQWCLIDALKCYETHTPSQSLHQLLKLIEEDLADLKAKRGDSLKLTGAIEDIMTKLQKLKTINCLGLPSPVKVADNISINNNGGHNHNQIQQFVKRRRIQGDDDSEDGYPDDNIYLHSPTPSPITTERNTSSDLNEPLEQVRRAAHEPTHLLLTHGTKSYTIRTPSHATKQSPHRPKVTKSHMEALKEYFVFATTFAQTGDPSMLAEYKIHQERQRKNNSLVELGVFDFINDMLRNVPHDTFPETLWSKNCVGSDKATIQFVKIVKYVLTGFHLLSHSSGYPISDHERTFFIEYVIPGLMAMSKTSSLFDFFWCEYEMQAVKEVDIFDKDFNLMKTQRRYIDALGKMTAGSEMEIVIVEASSGPLSENVAHSIEDTLKTFECTTSSLSTIASKYRHASITSFKKLQILSIQVIKNKMTLSTTSLNDRYSWKRMDLRVAEIPTKWTDRINMLRYFELLATLMNHIRMSIKVQNDLKNENVGSVLFEGQTIEEALALP